jgi:hypothetical protein
VEEEKGTGKIISVLELTGGLPVSLMMVDIQVGTRKSE